MTTLFYYYTFLCQRSYYGISSDRVYGRGGAGGSTRQALGRVQRDLEGLFESLLRENPVYKERVYCYEVEDLYLSPLPNKIPAN